MTATLRVTRETAFGFELRRGVFDISIDGNHVESVNNHDTIESPLAPGQHTIRVDKGRYSSGLRSFDVADGEVVRFRCHGAVVWPTYVASIVKPDLAISLKRE